MALLNCAKYLPTLRERMSIFSCVKSDKGNYLINNVDCVVKCMVNIKMTHMIGQRGLYILAINTISLFVINFVLWYKLCLLHLTLVEFYECKQRFLV